MIGVKDQNDRRDSWHHGGWTVKSVVWLLLVVLAFFLPDVVISVYGMLCKLYFLSGIDYWICNLTRIIFSSCRLKFPLKTSFQIGFLAIFDDSETEFQMDIPRLPNTYCKFCLIIILMYFQFKTLTLLTNSWHKFNYANNHIIIYQIPYIMCNWQLTIGCKSKTDTLILLLNQIHFLWGQSFVLLTLYNI